jgi:epoxyqueuosine reductase
METRKIIRFASNPEEFIRQAMTRFVEESPSNRRKVDGGRYFDAPLVGFASADDPLFRTYKAIIGKFHLSPRNVFDRAFGKGEGKAKLWVISWVLPICEDTRKANRQATRYPSLLWSHTRFFGEPFNEKLRRHLVALLTKRGYKAVAPGECSFFKHHMHAPKVGFTSNFSERHAAFISGLGTFGLCDGLITPRGKAVRLGSVITDLELKPSERPYDDRNAHCVHHFNGGCRACEARCPAGAITRRGHDKERCYDYMHNTNRPAKNSEYGVEITGCGLCQTKVPCEYEIPKVIRRHGVTTSR